MRRLYQCFNEATGALLLPGVEKADSLSLRVKGLLGRRSMESTQGLWIIPCKQIHTFFMRFPIDVLFLNLTREVLAVQVNIPPWRLSPFCLGAKSVLEMAGGALAGRVAVGDRLEFRKHGGVGH